MRERRGFGRGPPRGGGGFGGGFGRGRGGGFGEDRDRPKPVKEGEEYTVKITDVGAKGDGIAKIENFIVFVPDTKKGDEVRIRIRQVSGRFAVGEKVGEAASGGEGEEPEEPAEPESPEGDWEESSSEEKKEE